MIFSVIVPFYNEEIFIERCIHSLLNQDFDRNEYELIFVDNNSADRSAQVVNSYSDINLLSEGKRSAYAARNRGILAASGEILVFTDGDCEAEKDWLTHIYAGMKHLNAGIVLGSRCFASHKSIPLRLLAAYENAKIEYVLTTSLPKEYCYGFTNNMAVKGEIFEQSGLFPEFARGADTGFIQKYLFSDPEAKLIYLPKMLIRHLEVGQFIDWLNKQVIRGENNKRIGFGSKYKTLTAAMRLAVFRKAVKENGYGFSRSLILFLMLLLGNAFYIAGEIKTKLEG
jgi:glycosyltransferase involved in cell wall biosynthesis